MSQISQDYINNNNDDDDDDDDSNKYSAIIESAEHSREAVSFWAVSSYEVSRNMCSPFRILWEGTGERNCRFYLYSKLKTLRYKIAKYYAIYALH